MAVRRGRVLPTAHQASITDLVPPPLLQGRAWHHWRRTVLSRTVSDSFANSLTFTGSMAREPFTTHRVTLTSTFASRADTGTSHTIYFKSQFVGDTGLLASGRFRR